MAQPRCIEVDVLKSWLIYTRIGAATDKSKYAFPWELSQRSGGRRGRCYWLLCFTLSLPPSTVLTVAFQIYWEYPFVLLSSSRHSPSTHCAARPLCNVCFDLREVPCQNAEENSWDSARSRRWEGEQALDRQETKKHCQHISGTKSDQGTLRSWSSRFWQKET